MCDRSCISLWSWLGHLHIMVNVCMSSCQCVIMSVCHYCQCVIMSLCHYCHLHVVVRVLWVVCKSCHLWFLGGHVIFVFLSMCFEVVFIFWSMLVWVLLSGRLFLRGRLHFLEIVNCCQWSVKFVSVSKFHLYILYTFPVVSPVSRFGARSAIISTQARIELP